MLNETLCENKLSHHVTARLFKDIRIEDKERSFILALYLGVLEQLVLLDYNIKEYSSVPFEKIKPVIKNILRQALYQMFFMDSVPQRAAVYEAVRLVQIRKLASLKGFVNGILRNIQRNGLKEDMPRHVLCSVPQWMYEKLVRERGKDAAEDFFLCSLKKGIPACASLNVHTATEEEILRCLKEDGCSAVVNPDGICEIISPKKLEELKAYTLGYLYFQSPNSKITSRAAQAYLGSIKNPFIMDVCAAPGGKSINLALAFGGAQILASDRSAAKVSLIEENVKRMGLANIKTRVSDARVFDEACARRADLVVVDAPCSGIGVISNKPDIKYRLKEEDIPSLVQLQREILRASSGYVKEGGILVYSTCTLTKEENEDNAKWFAADSGFRLLSQELHFKYEERADGFYAAAFAKN